MKISSKISTLIALLTIMFVVGIFTPPYAAAEGSEDSSYFAVVAGSAITNIGASIITGDLGISPSTGVTGFPPGVVNGTYHINDATAVQLKLDLASALDDIGAITPVSTIPTELGGTTLTQGAYDSLDGTFEITGTLTLDAEGNPDAFFAFQADSTLVTAEDSNVVIINGGQACNVYWVIGSSATLGTNSALTGSILALESATLATGASVEGRVAVLNGAVTLDNNEITLTCALPPRPLAALHVIKLVVNESGGIAVASDFDVHLKNGGVDVAGSPEVGTAAPGTLYSLPAGTYKVSEEMDPAYIQTFTGDCDADGNVILSASDDKICTIINTDILPPSPPPSSGGNNSGSNRRKVAAPLIGILKAPTPLALPTGSGQVTYNYIIWNIGGQQALVDVMVTDDKCSPLTFISGDLDHDGKLDEDENWKYICTAMLSSTATNTATATGYDSDGRAAIATSVSTVVVGSVPRLPDTGSLFTESSKNILPALDPNILTKEKVTIIFQRPLSLGDHGADVSALQTAFVEKGLLIIPPGVTYGFFGPLTRAATIEYQSNVGLPLVGVFGPQTAARLIADLED